ncbi:hypothetical protein TVAG_042300 [Trichomonas vaginalis G3]|uniref:Uncharacterized protein n=1 Tax=Trichomonas vaginalis (strain ATCC PRA-98 / G3) TaxID=412133 RepID=A2EUW9_TRIV3|nr:hypothetical protein TVAGG3_0192520 [Trichomonas vaginalis G3]EAY03578.1 hypothetical protein TVAG_042300 [Trichomonas vaginalis G3]KAI5550084.1 hypothetical protein TVAGG3_0192520 [Trichomonas vaginalis G3]|eukprot:XP_001315801.1 hypothetical protein [Trichomonas vaginalis G3]
MYILQDVQLIYEQIQPRALKLIAIISNALVVAPPNYQQELIYMAISALKVYWQYASKTEFHNAITLVLNSALRTQYYYTICKFNELHQGGISKKKIVKLICERGLKYPVDFDIISEYSNSLDSATLITAVTALYNLGTENEIFTRISISLIFNIALKLGDKIDVRNYFADVIRKLFTLIGCLTQNNQNESLVLILCETLSSFTQNNVYWLQQCLISCFSSLKASKNSPEYFDALFKIDSNSSSKPMISRRTTLQERCQSTPKIPRLSLSDMNNSKTNQSRSRPNTSRDKMKLMTSSTRVANVSLTERRKEIPKSPKLPTRKSKNSSTLSKTTEIGPSIVVTSVKKLL